MLGLGLGPPGLAARQRAGALPPLPPAPPADAPLRIVATGGEVASAGVYANQGAGAIKLVCRTRHVLGGAGASEIRVCWGGYYCLTTGGETPHGNDQALAASIEVPGAPQPGPVRLRFAGETGGVIANGAAELVSDALMPAAFGYADGSFPAGTTLWLKAEREVATGGAVAKGRAVASPAIAGEGCMTGASGAPSQIDTAGALASGNGWTNRSERVFPLAILGRTPATQPSVLILGDSIATFSNDGAGDGINGGGGFARRALAGAAAHKVPWTSLSVPGERAQQLAASTKRAALYKYATHALSNYGTNDLGGARTAAQLRTDLRVIWAALKAGGVARVEQVQLLPRTSSTDGFASEAGQTPVTGFGAGGARDAANAAIAEDAGTSALDAAIDLHGGVAVGSDPRKWVANGTAGFATSDGTHPSSAIHAAMAAALMPRIAGWTA